MELNATSRLVADSDIKLGVCHTLFIAGGKKKVKIQTEIESLGSLYSFKRSGYVRRRWTFYEIRNWETVEEVFKESVDAFDNVTT